MTVHFTDDAWDDYLYWTGNDHDFHAWINALIQAVRRTLFEGVGKPEPLKGDPAGFWSRRITGEHRLGHAVQGKGREQWIVIVHCRCHY